MYVYNTVYVLTSPQPFIWQVILGWLLLHSNCEQYCNEEEVADMLRSDHVSHSFEYLLKSNIAGLYGSNLEKP